MQLTPSTACRPELCNAFGVRLADRQVRQRERLGAWQACLHASCENVEVNSGYEELEHAADWSFRVRARTLCELFTAAARALCRLEHGDRPQAFTVTREVEVEGVDRETLLVNWLNELLYLEQTNREVYHDFDIITIDNTHLQARVHGAPERNAQRHIKAVTFHNLELKQTADGWEATIVVDV